VRPEVAIGRRWQRFLDYRLRGIFDTWDAGAGYQIAERSYKICLSPILTKDAFALVETFASLKQLRTFAMVAETGSALAASGRLHVSQPAVCYSIARLESAFGVGLFERSASGSYLTAAGRLLHNRTSRLFAQLVEAVRYVNDPGGQGPDKSEAMAWKLSETQIRALVSIWRAGSFRAAARELSIAEPSLQRPARELERLLRVNLYRRTAMAIEVNPTGAELARRLSLALSEIWCAVEEIGATRQSTRAGLRVGVLALSPRSILAQATNELLASQPHQRIDVVEDSYENHVRLLRSGDIDIIYGALRSPQIPGDLTEQPLIADPYALVCRASHPLARRRNVAPRRLAQFDFVLPPQGLPRRTALDRMLTSWGIKPKSRIETSCLSTILALLRGSDRISLLSRWHVDHAEAGDLCCIDVEGAPDDPRFVGLTRRSHWLPTPFQLEFLRIIQRLSPARSSASRRSVRAISSA
jgi:DNA-binding transcriptional LysR family regulator